MSDNKKYSEIFDYLRTPELPDTEAGLIAFGRKDLLVARKIVDLSKGKFAKYVIISGGFGKDSGDLEIPEAEYLAQNAETIAAEANIKLPPLITETQAKNGGDNARNSLTVMRRAQLPYKDGLTAVAHATSLRRLAATIQHEAIVQNDEISKINRVPTDYSFDPSNPIDQSEAVAEMLRLADWPNKGWLQEQTDIPSDLIDFAREQDL